MAGGDPGLVVCGGAGSDGWAIGADNGYLLSRSDLLDASGSTLGTLATETTALLLWEEGGDPGAVDEVAGTAKGSSEEEVEEDAIALSQFLCLAVT